MALIAALVITALVTPGVAVMAKRMGIVDQPGALKVHEEPVPYLGGVAVLLGVLGPVAATRAAVLIPLTFALLLGLADDIVDLSPKVRLIGELGVGATAVATLPVTPTPIWSAGTIVLVVAMLNAVNLLDGLDGLAASVAGLGALGFAAVLDPTDRPIALALAGALAGFLVWNRPAARIYLGDAGSYLVGTALAMLFALVATSGDGIGVSAGAVLFVAVPVADTAVAIVRRARAGQPLLLGDRGHVYDQLVDRGWPPTRATLACASAQGALVLVGMAASALAGATAVAIVATVVVVVGASVLWTFTSPSSWAT